MALLVRLLLIFSFFTISESILCYQCSDTSEQPGRNDCQTYVRTMNRDRKRYLKDVYIDKPKYVKNCTGYKDLDELSVYCMIMEIKVKGSTSVQSYIRGCTDGKDFTDIDESVEIEDRVTFDNNTNCVNINNGLEACLTICGVEYGDFCNGYVSRATCLNLINDYLIFLLLVFMLIL